MYLACDSSIRFYIGRLETLTDHLFDYYLPVAKSDFDNSDSASLYMNFMKPPCSAAETFHDESDMNKET